MNMDDPRIEWVKDRVYQALDITDPEIFDDLLNRNDGESERAIAKFLNETPEENEQSVIFYKIVQEEEEEVEVECGKQLDSQIQTLTNNGQQLTVWHENRFFRNFEGRVAFTTNRYLDLVLIYNESLPRTTNRCFGFSEPSIPDIEQEQDVEENEAENDEGSSADQCSAEDDDDGAAASPFPDDVEGDSVDFKPKKGRFCKLAPFWQAIDSVDMRSCYLPLCLFCQARRRRRNGLRNQNLALKVCQMSRLDPAL